MEARPDFDVCVIGGGPAGAMAAAGLAARGRRILLIDPETPVPRRIESLTPDGHRLATLAGFLPALEQAELGRAEDMHLAWREENEVRNFAGEGPQLLDRNKLHSALRAEAVRQGAERLLARVRSISSDETGVCIEAGSDLVTARFAVDARGRRALKRGAAIQSNAGLIAVPFQLRSQSDARPRMFLHALPDGWIWACQIAGGSFSGAVLAPPKQWAGMKAPNRLGKVRDLLCGAALPGRADTLTAGRPVDAALAAADSPFTDAAEQKIFRVGDAALARDPIASHGLAHAFRQGAQIVAVLDTLLDPGEDPAAPLAFARDKHREAVAGAIAATSNAYADQSRHKTPFWLERSRNSVKPTGPAFPQIPPDILVQLASPLSIAAIMTTDRIRWGPVVDLPRSGQVAAFFGPLSADALAREISEPVMAGTLAARLTRHVPASEAVQIVRSLITEGALVEAPDSARSPSGSHRLPGEPLANVL